MGTLLISVRQGLRQNNGLQSLKYVNSVNTKGREFNSVLEKILEDA